MQLPKFRFIKISIFYSPHWTLLPHWTTIFFRCFATQINWYSSSTYQKFRGPKIFEIPFLREHDFIGKTQTNFFFASIACDSDCLSIMRHFYQIKDLWKTSDTWFLLSAYWFSRRKRLFKTCTLLLSSILSLLGATQAGQLWLTLLDSRGTDWKRLSLWKTMQKCFWNNWNASKTQKIFRISWASPPPPPQPQCDQMNNLYPRLYKPYIADQYWIQCRQQHCIVRMHA